VYKAIQKTGFEGSTSIHGSRFTVHGNSQLIRWLDDWKFS